LLALTIGSALRYRIGKSVVFLNPLVGDPSPDRTTTHNCPADGYCAEMPEEVSRMIRINYDKVTARADT
jgi:hypothetical protein